jgi:methionine-rich copper-binding protein CopC
MSRLLRATLATMLLTAVVAADGRHFSVVKSTPGKDQKLETAPARLQLWFSQAPAAAVSEIKLKRGEADVELGKTVILATDKSMYADPVKPLQNGAYALAWRAAGDDGHVLSGEIKFVVELKTRH